MLTSAVLIHGAVVAIDESLLDPRSIPIPPRRVARVRALIKVGHQRLIITRGIVGSARKPRGAHVAITVELTRDVVARDVLVVSRQVLIGDAKALAHAAVPHLRNA